MHSAFDGVHEFSVTPYVPGAAQDSLVPDPLDAESLVWHFDPTFFRASAFPELAGAVQLTTQQAGETEIAVVGTTVSGVAMRDTARVIIAQADPDVWRVGDARYSGGLPVRWGRFPLAAQGEGTCGLPFSIEVSRAAACVSCHDNSDEISTEYTPTQTAGYSDEDLLNIMLTGAKPAGGAFISPHLTVMPMPDCVFAEFHAFEMTETEKEGLIARVRSVPPRALATD